MPELRDDYREILMQDLPLLDVRAPVEFARGAFPTAESIPLLDDAERERIGTEYTDSGSAAAVALGHELVSGAVRQARLERWVDFTRRHPEGCLYCFRGGQRSQIVQQWLAAAGVEYPRVAGGYKALRRFLLQQLERLADTAEPIVVGGRTGTGKTELINDFDNAIDLEGLAHHRGSGFGRRATGQPAQIDFENAIAIAWLKLDARGVTHPIFEDESRGIGRCYLPEPLWAALGCSPVVLLEEPLADRVRRIRSDYIVGNLRDLERLHPGRGFDHFREHLLASLDRIEKRLGGVRHRRLKASMVAALDEQERSGESGGHDAWIERLLQEYYDPMYDYQIERKAARILARGDRDAIRAWLTTHGHRPAVVASERVAG